MSNFKFKVGDYVKWRGLLSQYSGVIENLYTTSATVRMDFSSHKLLKKDTGFDLEGKLFSIEYYKLTHVINCPEYFNEINESQRY